MKKCDQFKDLILTDYMDGEADKNITGEIESHLQDCGDCRAFLKEAQENTISPWKQAAKEPVPAGLWEAIRQNIDNENQPTPSFAGLIDRLKGLAAFPRLVPAFASFIVMLLAGSVTLNNMQVQQTRDQDQGEYLVSLLASPSSSLQAEGSDLGTPIEHYFL